MVQLETKVTLWGAREIFYGIIHDYPCLGATKEYKTYNKLKGIYSSHQQASKKREKILQQWVDLTRDLDKFDKLRIMVQKYGWSFNDRNEPKHGAVVKKIIVPKEKLIKKGETHYLKKEGRTWKIH